MLTYREEICRDNRVRAIVAGIVTTRIVMRAIVLLMHPREQKYRTHGLRKSLLA